MPAPYDSVSTVLNTARTRLNDEIKTLQPVSGKLLLNNQVFTQQTVNTAWRKFQEFLGNLGCTEFTQEYIITGIPPTTNLDPASQTYINWFGFFDGTTFLDNPKLPQNLMSPLWVKERQTGTQSQFIPMEMINDGLPTWGKGPRLGYWEWRRESIYMPGATFETDLRLRYITWLGDFLDETDTPWYQQDVPVMRCLDSLSMFICAEIAETRDDLDQDRWREKAEEAAKLFMNRDTRMKQRGNTRRVSRSGRLESNCYGGYGGYY